jgi:hypothetical protein
MKEHISITLDRKTTHLLKRNALQEQRSVSQLVELAVRAYLKEKTSSSESIVSTPGAFKGVFSRQETYAGR